MSDILERLKEFVGLDKNNDRCPSNPCITVREVIVMANEIERLRNECETERMRLAVCGVAAFGYFDGCKDEYWSASLNDVLQLRSEIERLRRELEEAKRPDENLAWALNSGDGVYRP